jgi:hypothetical protein
VLELIAQGMDEGGAAPNVEAGSGVLAVWRHTRLREAGGCRKCTLILPVTGFGWQHPSHPAARISLVALVAGDQVDMHVSDGLTGGWAVVDADVVGVWSKFRVEDLFLVTDELEQRVLLLSGQVEAGANMAFRYDQRMAGRHGKGIADGKS